MKSHQYSYIRSVDVEGNNWKKSFEIYPQNENSFETANQQSKYFESPSIPTIKDAIMRLNYARSARKEKNKIMEEIDKLKRTRKLLPPSITILLLQQAVKMSTTEDEPMNFEKEDISILNNFNENPDEIITVDNPKMRNSKKPTSAEISTNSSQSSIPNVSDHIVVEQNSIMILKKTTNPIKTMKNSMPADIDVSISAFPNPDSVKYTFGKFYTSIGNLDLEQFIKIISNPSLPILEGREYSSLQKAVSTDNKISTLLTFENNLNTLHDSDIPLVNCNESIKYISNIKLQTVSPELISSSRVLNSETSETTTQFLLDERIIDEGEKFPVTIARTEVADASTTLPNILFFTDFDKTTPMTSSAPDSLTTLIPQETSTDIINLTEIVMPNEETTTFGISDFDKGYFDSYTTDVAQVSPESKLYVKNVFKTSSTTS